MRFDGVECEHGCPGGTPATCALCRVAAAAALERAAWLELVDVRALAAADR